FYWPGDDSPWAGSSDTAGNMGMDNATLEKEIRGDLLDIFGVDGNEFTNFSAIKPSTGFLIKRDGACLQCLVTMINTIKTRNVETWAATSTARPCIPSCSAMADYKVLRNTNRCVSLTPPFGDQIAITKCIDTGQGIMFLRLASPKPPVATIIPERQM